MKTRYNALSTGICIILISGVIACLGGLGLAILRLLAGAADNAAVNVLHFP